MFLNAKKIAFLGLLLSFTVILVILSSILEFNTLFLLAGASFCIGVAIRESNLRFGFGFLVGATILSFILSPNKIYCITFAAMGLYLFIYEFSWQKLGSSIWKDKGIGKRKMLFVIIRYIAFNTMYIPTLLLFPHLIFKGELSKTIVVTIFFVGQIVLWIYDKAYCYFQLAIWEKIRKL